MNAWNAISALVFGFFAVIYYHRYNSNPGNKAAPPSASTQKVLGEEMEAYTEAGGEIIMKSKKALLGSEAKSSPPGPGKAFNCTDAPVSGEACCNPSTNQKCPPSVSSGLPRDCPACGSNSCACDCFCEGISCPCPGDMCPSDYVPLGKGGSFGPWFSTKEFSVPGHSEPMKRIVEERVIDAFMEQHPDIRTILWERQDDEFRKDQEKTVRLAEEYGRRLVTRVSTADQVWKNLTDQGFYKTEPGQKRSHWIFKNNKKWTRSVKEANDFLEKNGPNNGWMRLFFHDVAIKLQAFNSSYGWDSSLLPSFVAGDGQNERLFLVNHKYEKEWENPDQDPRVWIIPQMHYLGFFANDPACGNFAYVKYVNDTNEKIKPKRPAVPVDTDAVQRTKASGEVSTFLKINAGFDCKVFQGILTPDYMIVPKDC